jgi:very-short-patch-repair endonuclease
MCNSNRLCENEECKTCFEKSFASHEKSKYLSEKTGHVKPRQVFKFSHTKYWFDCDCGHQFESALSNIAKNKWCPYCANPPKQLCENADCKPCFEKSFASHEKSKYWSEKNGVKPRHIFKASSNKYWFDCVCGHEFNSSLDQITGKRQGWCPYCSNPPKQLCENEDCKPCFEKSFASHEKSKYWSEKNDHVIPRHIFKASSNKYWFDCVCGHEFNSSLDQITGKRQCWCPYCANQKLCENEDCKTCFEKSFASHEKSKYWSDKNIITPRQVSKRTHEKYWFNCICGHDFKKKIEHITENNSWCPYCCNTTQKLCHNNECKKCYENSFASHEKSKYWSDKNLDENGNIINPRQVVKGSGNKYYFMCDYNHDFNSSLDQISGKKTWCPICVNKTEKKIYEQLLKIYPSIVSQFRSDWCKNIISKRNLPFDFVIEEQKIIIELDGAQHFVQVMNWKTPEENLNNDQYKQKCANENGYSVIRIIQEDVWNDAYDWLNELTQNIIKITSEHAIQNIYMCKNNEYNTFNSRTHSINLNV